MKHNRDTGRHTTLGDNTTNTTDKTGRAGTHTNDQESGTAPCTPPLAGSSEGRPLSGSQIDHRRPDKNLRMT